jgi:ketosteroid isomerase-like protein
MRKWLAAMAMIFALLAAPAFAQHEDDPIAAAAAAFAEMRAGWNRGDIEVALSAYWDSPDITWVNRTGISYGFDDFAAEMRTAYADAPETMGIYTAELLGDRVLSENEVLLIARWDISRGDERLYGGVSTMLWRRIDGKWKIVFEHASQETGESPGDRAGRKCFSPGLSIVCSRVSGAADEIEVHVVVRQALDGDV